MFIYNLNFDTIVDYLILENNYVIGCLHAVSTKHFGRSRNH